MANKTKAMLAGAAFAGLLSGSAIFAAPAMARTNANPSINSQDKPAYKPEVEKHACKGKNSCKGKGGCKSSDNGCKAKNSCKGKGGCATDGSKMPG
jgi:hypothetical protein